MKIDILDAPIRFDLHGIRGIVGNDRYGEVGFRLMNEMWRVVKSAGIATMQTGLGTLTQVGIAAWSHGIDWNSFADNASLIVG